MSETSQLSAIQYHEATKHHYNRYAQSSGYLDWESQPNPFRFYEGVQPIKLPFAETAQDAEHMALYEKSGNPVQPFTRENLSLFLELSLGISAWKSIPGAKWALRMNPSSGNLHPTEGYIVMPLQGAYEPGVYHYSPYWHALEPRAKFSESVAQQLKANFPAEGFLFAFTSIYWREAWKYGERAFRYCNHDIGHAIAAVSFAANLLGWKFTYCPENSDEELGQLLGLHKTSQIQDEQEAPELLGFIHPSHLNEIPAGISSELIHEISELSFQGQANPLSKSHIDWDIITEVSKVTEKPRGSSTRANYPNPSLLEGPVSRLKAHQIIRQRRSAVALDGKTSISKEVFFSMLDKTLPRETKAPFDFKLGPICVHLFLFVHRVINLASGLYMFVRTDEHLEDLKRACSLNFLWQRVQPELPLYLLRAGSFTREATAVSCGQHIAGEGAFSLGMIAKFRTTVEPAPYLYRQLFWETGMIGQVLYLEAEANGIRGTGIGCFFDDPVHQIMGLHDNTFQSLYHFTVGGSVEDGRLQAWPAYAHLEESKKELPAEYVSFFQLFNQEKYFEAHEVLEDLWRKEKGENRRFYQGLIQIAAAFVHIQRGNKTGALNLYQKARTHLECYPSFYLGVNVSMILQDVPHAIENNMTGYKIEIIFKEEF